MIKIFQLFCILCFGIYFSQINVEEIRRNVTENPQEYFYSYLEIFKKDPSGLTQEQMNQLYYGSRFIKEEDEPSDYREIWKSAEKRMSKNKAEEIVAKAEQGYAKDPLSKSVLNGMSNIYKALGNTSGKDLADLQYKTIIKTIEKSGTGQSEDSPKCVIWAGDVIARIDELRGYEGSFKQEMKTLQDGSVLTIYSKGKKKIFVKLVGGFKL